MNKKIKKKKKKIVGHFQASVGKTCVALPCLATGSDNV